MNRKFISKSNRVLRKVLNTKENIEILEEFIEVILNINIDDIELNSYLESKKNNLDKLIFGLGIRHCGSKIARILCRNFKNIEGLKNATYEQIITIGDIGDAIAKEFVLFMQDSANINMLDELSSLGLNMQYQFDEIKVNYFTNKKCVLTGTLMSMGRSEAKKIIEGFGGSLSESVSKKTDILILGENPGSKYDKAKKLGIYIMQEDEFLDKIKE